jgi:hypothetical protein
LALLSLICWRSYGASGYSTIDAERSVSSMPNEFGTWDHRGRGKAVLSTGFSILRFVMPVALWLVSNLWYRAAMDVGEKEEGE